MIVYLFDNLFTVVFLAIFYVLGIGAAAVAILKARTPQGATAWVMSLLGFPFFSVPLFLIFGRSKFEGYNTRRRLLDSRVQDQFDSLDPIDSSLLTSSDEMQLIHATISRRNQPGFTRKNSVKLLLNGEEVYRTMWEEMEKAQSYIILQCYIFRADETGRKFAEILMRKARSGVRVTFLNDEIGQKVPKSLLRELVAAGVKIGSFNNRNGLGRLQVNFRNHRKILIVDGRVGFVGGLNVGDDYLGKWKRYGYWRDTHLRLTGPSVIAAQLATAKDWFCINESPIDADWKIYPGEEDSNVIVLHTGPADEKHTCLLSHIALINSASKRLWIANPYIVPPESLMDAIILAALRGVDVRIITPAYSDSRTVMLATKVYQEMFLKHGIKIFQYNRGFSHQKTMLVDDRFAVVGSANFDCRSMFINFEVSAISTDGKLIADLEQMFLNDFNDCREMNLGELKKLSLWERIASRGANLLAPVL